MEKKDLIYHFSPERAFIFVGIIYGILFLLVTPPFEVPDEPTHFARAIHVSELGVLAQKSDHHGVGAFLPKSFYVTYIRLKGNVAFHSAGKQYIKEILSLLKFPLDWDNTMFVDFPAQALYTPIPYLPQASGIALGRRLNLSPLILFYLGRTSNLFVWIFLIYLAIKITPVSKWLFFLLALTPMSLFQASSLSADCFTNGISFLLISLFLQYSLDETKTLKRVDILLIFVLSLLLSLSKQVYFLILFLFLLIPVKKLATKETYFVTFALLCLINIAALALWSFSVKDFYVPFRSGVFVAPYEQIRLLFAHSLKYGRIVINTFMQNGNDYAEEFIGRLGWLDTNLPSFVTKSYPIILFFVALTSREKNIKASQKLLIGIVLFVTLMLVSISQYLLWTKVGGTIIDGMQGRYFIPIAPLLFLLFINTKIGFNVQRLSPAIICYSLLSLSTTVFVLLKRYYL